MNRCVLVPSITLRHFLAPINNKPPIPITAFDFVTYAFALSYCNPYIKQLNIIDKRTDAQKTGVDLDFTAAESQNDQV